MMSSQNVSDRSKTCLLVCFSRVAYYVYSHYFEQSCPFDVKEKNNIIKCIKDNNKKHGMMLIIIIFFCMSLSSDIFFFIHCHYDG